VAKKPKVPVSDGHLAGFELRVQRELETGSCVEAEHAGCSKCESQLAVEERTVDCIVSLHKPAWAPPQCNLSGDNRHVLTEYEYTSALRHRTCDDLEKYWGNGFNKSIGLSTTVDSICGPQAVNENEIRQGARHDLQVPRRAKCDSRGDCKRYSLDILRFGDNLVKHMSCDRNCPYRPKTAVTVTDKY
jgi:hypothetical protein